MLDFNRLSPMYSYIDFHIEMSTSCTFFVLLARYMLHMVVQTFVVHSGQSPHSVTNLIHKYHVDIQWISVPSHRFCGTR